MYTKFVNADNDIMKVMEDEYIFVMVNWSTENKSPDAMAYLGYPERFGFPVFVIVDGDGSILHIQDTALLEEGKDYNKKHIMQLLTVWTSDAVNRKRSSKVK